MLNARKQRGISIVEILIAFVIGIVVVGAILSLFATTVNSSDRIIQEGNLNRELHTIMDIMVKDIQRAGYWGNATSSSTNPFMSTDNDLTVNGSSDCILFTYDRNGDGTVATIAAGSDDEHYGYRKDGSKIQYRIPGASYDCAAASGDWEDLTNTDNVTITALSVTTDNQAVDIDGTGSGTDTTTYRTVTITLTGRLPNDTDVTKTITRTIKIYNNKYVP